MDKASSLPRTQQLGASGITVSALSWGTWRLVGADPRHVSYLLRTALDHGINLIDVADIYGFNGQDGFGDLEQMLGAILRQQPGLRERMVLVGKGGILPPIPYNSSVDYLHHAIDASLARLGIDAFDVWLIHRPDLLAHPQEVAAALETAVKVGKVRAVGVSNHTPAQIEALAALCPVPLAVTQPEFSALHLEPMESGATDQAMRLDMAMMAWSPLGGGKIANPDDERSWRVAQALDAIAGAQGVARAAVAYAWLMAHPAMPIPILGTANPERIVEATGAFEVTWTREAWYSVLVASRGAPMP